MLELAPAGPKSDATAGAVNDRSVRGTWADSNLPGGKRSAKTFREVLGVLSVVGVPHCMITVPGIHVGSPAPSIKPWLCTVKTLMPCHTHRHYVSLVSTPQLLSFQPCMLATQARLIHPCN